MLRRCSLLSAIERTRLQLTKTTAAHKKSQLGQFLTPANTARFMAGLFRPTSETGCRLLDPGAGIGSLSCAFLERCQAGGFSFKSIDVAAYELDNSLHGDLERSLQSYTQIPGFTYKIVDGDFIEEAVTRIQFRYGNFTHAILNPPYKKISSNSRDRSLLRHVGIETVNLYSAFTALAIALMTPGGQVVAIIPRSFCNGPYYRPFRDFILKRAAIHHIHLFASRDKAFKDDDVLQENVVIFMERDGQQKNVTISTSTDSTFKDITTYIHPFDRIVLPDDPEQFIHVPTSVNHSTIELSSAIRYSLNDIGVKVSTGPVVDFRVKEHLRAMPEPDTVPLLYPGHFSEQHIDWPKQGFKKPNAIQRHHETEKWLYPNGFYCIVRRFSSKEEKRRIVASVVRPDAFQNTTALGFENHLNVFHENKHGLPEALAYGLAMFLNTTAIDEHFRRFNGHTQVNATDLRLIKYPSRNTLTTLGEWAMRQKTKLSQTMLDEQLEKLTA